MSEIRSKLPVTKQTERFIEGKKNTEPSTGRSVFHTV